MSGRRWLVTGGAGYIGAHVVRALLRSGAEVVVLDDLSTGLASRVPAGVELIQGSVTDSAQVEQTLRRIAPDVVGARYRQHEASTTAHAERSGVYHYRRPHESRIAFLAWVDHHARSSGLADPSVQQALRVASARYENRRAELTLGDRLMLLGQTGYGMLGSARRRAAGRLRRGRRA